MKKICALALTIALAACGEASAPTDAGAVDTGTVAVEEGKEWTADTAQEGAVDVTLPETPLKVEPAAPGADAVPAATPAQPSR